MGIKRYTADQDSIITNGFNYTLDTRGTGSNMGYADSLEAYSIYGQTSGSTTGRTQELARSLLQFPIATVSADRTAGRLPAAGSVSFYLRMFNVEHAFTLPEAFTLDVLPVSRSWAEGTGLDMEEYTDLGSVNWMRAQPSASADGGMWTTVGGDYHASPTYSTTFPRGYEDLEVNITPLVEQWISGVKDNYGVGIQLTSSEEAYHSSSTGLNVGSVLDNLAGSTNTYYTKRFSSRSSQYFFKRPVLEARWDSAIQDDRENFYYSSSLAPAIDNLNTLYIYNYIRGRLVDIPAVGTGDIYLSLYSGSTSPADPKLLLYNSQFNVTGGHVSTGIYSASVAITAAATPLKTMFDVWHYGGSEYRTGSLYPVSMPLYEGAPTFERVTNITNLKKEYSRQETARFRLFVRDKDWSPNVYVVATNVNPTVIIESASYSIERTTDNLQAIPYGTGSNLHTLLSYDVSGNYFDLDMSLLEAGYMYRINLSYYNDSIGDWVEQPYTFKFRVEE